MSNIKELYLKVFVFCFDTSRCQLLVLLLIVEKSGCDSGHRMGIVEHFASRSVYCYICMYVLWFCVCAKPDFESFCLGHEWCSGTS